MREQMIEALKQHALGHIEKHKINVEILLQKTASRIKDTRRRWFQIPAKTFQKNSIQNS